MEIFKLVSPLRASACLLIISLTSDLLLTENKIESSHFKGLTNYTDRVVKFPEEQRSLG